MEQATEQPPFVMTAYSMPQISMIINVPLPLLRTWYREALFRCSGPGGGHGHRLVFLFRDVLMANVALEFKRVGLGNETIRQASDLFYNGEFSPERPICTIFPDGHVEAMTDDAARDLVVVQKAQVLCWDVFHNACLLQKHIDSMEGRLREIAGNN